MDPPLQEIFSLKKWNLVIFSECEANYYTFQLFPFHFDGSCKLKLGNWVLVVLNSCFVRD